MTTPPSKQLDQFVVRLPDGMRDRIKHAAEANNRSMNAEIVATLERAYPPVEFHHLDLHAFVELYDHTESPEQRASMIRKLELFLRSSGANLLVRADREGDITVSFPADD